MLLMNKLETLFETQCHCQLLSNTLLCVADDVPRQCSAGAACVLVVHSAACVLGAL